MKREVCYRAALSYLDRGWAALALCPPDHNGVPDFHLATCQSPGKRPLGRWKGWQSRLPTLGELEAQWDLVPRANVGVVLGRVSGLVGIDVDGPQGERLLREAAGDEGTPATVVFRTARGMRLLYAQEDGTTARSWSIQQDGSEMKVLGEGSLTVMPPSCHVTGATYRWVRRRGPGHINPAIAPGWVFRRPGRPVRGPGCRGTGGGGVGTLIPKGRRNETLFRIACAMRGRGMTEEEILVEIRAVNRRCVPSLSPREVQAIAVSVFRYPKGLLHP